MSLDPLAAHSAAPAVRSPAVVDAAARQAQANDNGANPGGDDQELTFWDVLDIVNPLQHIPIVNSIYRAVTGDQIKPAMQIAGGALFGGVIGGAVAIANAVVEEVSGDSITGHIVSGLGFGDDKTAVAQAPAAAQPGQNAAASMAAAQPAPSPRPANPAQQTPMQQAQAQAQAQQAAGQQAAANPAGALSGALAAAANRGQAQGVNPNDVMRSGHVPNKMPTRDVMLTTNMPRDSRGANLDIAPAVDRAGMALPHARSAANRPPATGQTAQNAAARNAAPAATPQAAPQTAPAAPAQAASAAPPAQPPTPANPDAMADVMLRNLAKYQAGKRAPAPTMRTSG